LSEADVFEMDGKMMVLLCENELFEYSGRFEGAGEISQDG